ncbi:Nuclease-sensitive element-binding protein 1 [Fasciolopsis buskii]|uniref:Nuclease-sensitive element-binding protein 1 n=1 Tax=Fasciolopsis buskii TaxID=27845 RepID=A0A8E0S1P0_9TREM|nr:Nuclease-sensitive element-binding protein 1 [Fasciolopsis buski]
MAAVVETPSEVAKTPKKEVEVVKVLAEKVRGHVKWYSASRHYGFISRNDDGGDLFVHRSVISAYSKRFPSLRTGEEVEFSVVETNQGIEATYVTGPGGQPVKGLRPLYRRYRTTSEPNANSDPTQAPQADPSGGGDGTRQRQGGRRPRGFRRRGGAGGGRMRSNQNDSRATDDGQENESPQANGGVTDGEARSGIDSGAQGDSPNRAVPRQRRRPQRRGVRHRSAPTEGEAAAEESQGDGGDPSGEPQSQPPPRELRNQGRPFRRPFRVRGGSFRYMNGYSNPPGKFGEHIDGAGHGQRQNQFSGRNGYDRNGGIPRRRGYGYRGTRRRRPDQEGRAVNGDHAVNEDTTVEKPGSGPQEVDEGLSKQLEQVNVGDAAAVDPESGKTEPVMTNGAAEN